MNTYKITGLGSPSASTDAATKGYVDAAAAGIDWKASVRVATTAAVTLASDLENGDTVDGITLATGNRVLVKNQVDGAENGIYVVKASGAPDRATDADTGTEVTASMAVFVEEGTNQADSGWTLTNNGTVTIGSTELAFTQFTGLGQVIAGTGLDKTGNTLDIDSTVTTNDGTQTLTNKTITSPTVSGLSLSDSSIVFEGATADAYETTLTVTDPTADRTLTLPNATGTIALTSDITTAVDAITTDAIEEGSTNKYFTDERAQDAVGNSVGTGLSYNDTTGSIGVNPAEMINKVLDAVSGNSYGMIGNASYLEIDNTNGYHKEIDVNITALETKLSTDGYITTTSTSTLTNKTLTSPKINEDVVLTATATELNVLDGITATTAELNILDGVTADYNELNILDGATLTTTELNYVDGVTSAIQTQLNTKTEKYTTTNTSLIPSSGSVTWTVTHNRGSRAVLVQVFDTSSYEAVEVDVTRTDTNTVTLSWVSSTTVSAGAYTVVVIG